MTQPTQSQGQEGGLAPALLAWHPISGGKPAFDPEVLVLELLTCGLDAA